MFYCFISAVPILALVRTAATLLNTPANYVYAGVESICTDSVVRKTCSRVLSLLLFGVGWLLLLASLQPFLGGLELSTEKLVIPSSSVSDAYLLFSRYHVTNSYGLFRRMTGVGGRTELVIQGSLDGKNWRDYELPYKPQNFDKRPQFNAPHQPRLDWQMWFAALGSLNENVWIVNLVNRLFYNSPSVLTLFQNNPFEDQPPDHIRMQYYLTNFTTIESHPWAGEQLSFPEAVSKAWNTPNPNWWTGKYVVDWLPRITQSDKKLNKLWKKWQLPDPDEMRLLPPAVHPLHYFPVVDACLGILAVKVLRGLFRAFF